MTIRYSPLAIRLSLPLGLENLHELAVDIVIAADDMAGLQGIIIALNAGDDAAGFADHELPGGDVPRLQIALPVAVEPAGGDEGHVERRGAEPAQARDAFLKLGHLGPELVVIAAADMRQAAGDHALVQPAAAGDAQPLVVEEGALAALGDIELVIGRIV